MASLELSIIDPMQLFNSMDPAPFHERDLDSEVVDYIVDWAQEVAPEAPLELIVTVHHAAPPANGAALISDADTLPPRTSSSNAIAESSRSVSASMAAG